MGLRNRIMLLVAIGLVAATAPLAAMGLGMVRVTCSIPRTAFPWSCLLPRWTMRTARLPVPLGGSSTSPGQP